MTDRPFQRPGSSRQPHSSWPYHPPSPLPPSQVEGEGDVASAATESVAASTGPAPPTTTIRRRAKGTPALVAAGIAGLVIGATITGVLASLSFGEPPPRSITVESFPEYVLGRQREDLAAISAGDSEALRRFEARVMAQMPDFQFVHGGEGATVAYGASVSLTIVDGRQALPLPTRAAGRSAGGAPTLVSLESAEVSCIFQPEVSLYDSAVLAGEADLTASGFTDCVLNDDARNLSLRLTSLVPGGAATTSADFAEVLRRTHEGLTA